MCLQDFIFNFSAKICGYSPEAGTSIYVSLTKSILCNRVQSWILICIGMRSLNVFKISHRTFQLFLKTKPKKEAGLFFYIKKPTNYSCFLKTPRTSLLLNEDLKEWETFLPRLCFFLVLLFVGHHNWWEKEARRNIHYKNSD